MFDWETIQSSIESLSSTIKNLDVIIKFTTQKIGKSTVPSEDIIEIRKKLIEARELILTLKEEEATIKDKISNLKQEEIKLINWKEEKKKYIPILIGDRVNVYTLHPNFKSTEPPHWLCYQCFQNNKKSILQVTESVPSYRSLGISVGNEWSCEKNHKFRLDPRLNPSNPQL